MSVPFVKWFAPSRACWTSTSARTRTSGPSLASLAGSPSRQKVTCTNTKNRGLTASRWKKASIARVRTSWQSWVILLEKKLIQCNLPNPLCHLSWPMVSYDTSTLLILVKRPNCNTDQSLCNSCPPRQVMSRQPLLFTSQYKK